MEALYSIYLPVLVTVLHRPMAIKAVSRLPAAWQETSYLGVFFGSRSIPHSVGQLATFSVSSWCGGTVIVDWL